MVYKSHLFLRYWLGPREDKNEPPSKQDLGSLRLRVCHTEDHVFPSNFYDPLREAILGIKDGQVKKFRFVCFRYLCTCTSKFDHFLLRLIQEGKPLASSHQMNLLLFVMSVGSGHSINSKNVRERGSVAK